VSAKADASAKDLRDIVEEARSKGASALVALAAYLNSDNVPTPRGSTWHDINAV
jgi:hypothetical protein